MKADTEIWSGIGPPVPDFKGNHGGRHDGKRNTGL